MTSRRRFLQALAALPPLLRQEWAAAADADPPLALVVGNTDYRQAPLLNPENDAIGMGKLLGEAGFRRTTLLNAPRDDLMAAINRFGEAVKRSRSRLAVFYYAGHGVQLDWRNYLLPVDAVVTRAEDIASRCVDLGALLGHFSAATGKSFVVILDACRDNPFGDAWKPSHKGLSQFDAPPGSLLAYATAPGSVAADGAGGNGLYTGHLLRELAVRSARLEDTLKRVRLNVRLASGGQQVPWETTSLESEIYLFPDKRQPLGEEELEAQLEADLAAWGRIKSSQKLEDWVGYLRQFPNGRFAEIAQMRLSRLLEEADARMRTGPAPALKAKAPATTPALLLGPDIPPPVLLPPSGNPYSAGRYPLNRVYTAGDEVTTRQTDLLTGIEDGVRTSRVTRVDAERDMVVFNDGAVVTDLMGNALKVGPVHFDVPAQLAPTELHVGRKWTAAFRRTQNGVTTSAYYDLHVERRETITVPAGRFDTFKIVGAGWNTTNSIQLETRVWLVPGLITAIRREAVARRQGRFIQTERHDLVALRQQVFRIG